MDNWFESEQEQEADNPKQTNGKRDEQRRYGDDGAIISIGAENNQKSSKHPHPIPCSNRIRSDSSSTRLGESSESKLGSNRRRNYRKRSRGCGDNDESDDFGFEDAKRLAEEKLIDCVDGDGDLVARKLLALQNNKEIVAQPQAAAHVVASAASPPPPPPPPPIDRFRLDMTASDWFRQLDNCTRIREAEEALKKELFTEPLDIGDDSDCRGEPKCYICFCDVCHELRRGFYTYYNSSQRRSPDCDEAYEEKMTRHTWARMVASDPADADAVALSAAVDASKRLTAHCLRYLELINNGELM